MRIVLVHPTGSNWVPGKRDITPTANRMAPLGLLSIAAYLERAGHQVFVHDCLGPEAPQGNTANARIILDYRPDMAIQRNLSFKMAGRAIKMLKEEDTEALFDSPFLVLTAKSHVGVIQFLTKTIRAIEKAVTREAKLRKEFQLLKTISGIGDILALTIMLEVGDISRFPKVGNYSSYCRCVKSEKLSKIRRKREKITGRMATDTCLGVHRGSKLRH